MNPPIKAIAVTLLAGVFAGSITACSKDLATGPADKPAAEGVQADVGALVATNDDFDNALAIALPFRHTIEPFEATTAPDDPLGDCDIVENTVWYQFIPTENVRIFIHTGGTRSFLDPGFAVYTGTRGNLSLVGCRLFNGLAIDAVAGETYFFMVGSVSGDPEPIERLVFNVDVSLKIDIAIDPVGAFDPSTGLVTISGTLTCSRSTFVGGLGANLRQREASTSFFVDLPDCLGETSWEMQAIPTEGRVEGGPAEVTVVGNFTDNRTMEEFNQETSSTVLLRVRGSDKQ